MEMKEEWLMPGAVVPVDAETTAALVAEIKRLIGIIGGMALGMQPAQQQEPVAWMGTDAKGNPNKFRLSFFSGAFPLFATPEDRSLIATNEKDGSPCPEFWDWLPKAYNFDGDGAFTKYNMEVAFLAGKQSVASIDTLQECVEKTQKQRHDTSPPPRKPLTDEEILKRYDEYVVEQQNVIAFARAIEAAHGIKGEA